MSSDGCRAAFLSAVAGFVLYLAAAALAAALGGRW